MEHTRIVKFVIAARDQHPAIPRLVFAMTAELELKGIIAKDASLVF